MLAPGSYWHDTVIRIPVTFTDTDGVPVDPATVAFKTMSPCGVELTLTYLTDAALARASAGSYYADITPNEPGRWHYRWETTGTGTTLRSEGDFIIQASQFYEYRRQAYS